MYDMYDDALHTVVACHRALNTSSNILVDCSIWPSLCQLLQAAIMQMKAAQAKQGKK